MQPDHDRAHRRALRFKPERLAADTAYGSAANLNWLVNEKRIAPHIPVIDKSKRDDGTFSREDFTFDKARDLYICPAGELLTTTGTVSTDHGIRYIAARAGVPGVPTQAEMLPEHARSYDCARHQRGCPRRSSSATPRPRPSSALAASASVSRCCSLI